MSLLKIWITPNAIGGWWDEVTNGVVRDLDMLDPDFPVLAGSIGPSHGYVHLVDIGQPVRVMDMEVMAVAWWTCSKAEC